MKRKLFTLLAAISLLLCVATTGCGMPRYYRNDATFGLVGLVEDRANLASESMGDVGVIPWGVNCIFSARSAFAVGNFSPMVLL